MSGLESDKLLDKLAAESGPEDECLMSFRMKVLGHYESDGNKIFVFSPDTKTEVNFKKKFFSKGKTKSGSKKRSFLSRISKDFGETFFSWNAKPGEMHYLKMYFGASGIEAKEMKDRILEEAKKSTNSKRGERSWASFFDRLDQSLRMNKEELEALWVKHNTEKDALKGTVKAAKRHPKVSEKKRQKKGSQEVQAGGGSGGGSGFSEHAVLVGAC